MGVCAAQEATLRVVCKIAHFEGAGDVQKLSFEPEAVLVVEPRFLCPESAMVRSLERFTSAGRSGRGRLRTPIHTHTCSLYLSLSRCSHTLILPRCEQVAAADTRAL